MAGIREKEIEIEGEKYVIKRWTLAEKASVQDAIVEDGDRKLPSLNTMLVTLKNGLKSAPFEITLDNLRNLDGATADNLFIQIFQFNTLPLPNPIRSASPSVVEQPKVIAQ